MGAHLIGGEFQSDKYPSCPRGKVPLSVKDKTAQDLLWEYAERRRSVDAEFSEDLETALTAAGYVPEPKRDVKQETYAEVRALIERAALAHDQLAEQPSCGSEWAEKFRAGTERDRAKTLRRFAEVFLP